jgi:hypothetical protein
LNVGGRAAENETFRFCDSGEELVKSTTFFVVGREEVKEYMLAYDELTGCAILPDSFTCL